MPYMFLMKPSQKISTPQTMIITIPQNYYHFQKFINLMFWDDFETPIIVTTPRHHCQQEQHGRNIFLKTTSTLRNVPTGPQQRANSSGSPLSGYWVVLSRLVKTPRITSNSSTLDYEGQLMIDIRQEGSIGVNVAIINSTANPWQHLQQQNYNNNKNFSHQWFPQNNITSLLCRHKITKLQETTEKKNSENTTIRTTRRKKRTRKLAVFVLI